MSETLIPTVGMDVTMYFPNDRYGGEITRVAPSGKFFFFRLDGREEEERRAYLDKRGTWRVSKGYAWVQLGVRETYLDPGA